MVKYGGWVWVCVCGWGAVEEDLFVMPLARTPAAVGINKPVSCGVRKSLFFLFFFFL